MSYRIEDSFRAGPGWNCPKHVEFPAGVNLGKLVHLVGFIIKKFVAIHGHMNVKSGNSFGSYQTVAMAVVYFSTEFIAPVPVIHSYSYKTES